MLKHSTFGQCLRKERQYHKMTQKVLAQHLAVTKLTIIRWENDQTFPHPQLEAQIYAFFNKDADTFGITKISIWNVPFERNPYFRGRETVLNSLHEALSEGGSIAITQHALSGLGGIGKTQTAIEYAYRFGPKYKAVLWVRADSLELLTSDFAALAELLNLREKTATYQLQAIQAVKSWLQDQPSWLLVFDNVEEMNVLSDFLPTRRSGSILITTRARVQGRYIRKLDSEKLNSRESLLLLFQRTKLIEDESQIASISEEERFAA